MNQAMELGWSGPPFDPELFASLQGLRTLTVDTLGDGREAAIDGRTIYVCRTPFSARRRYSIAHEIAHSLIDEVFGALGASESSIPDAESAEIESLCQILAAEILMPIDVLPSALARGGASPEVIGQFAAQFEVSLEAAARRVASTSLRPVAIIFVKRRDECESNGRAPVTSASRGRSIDFVACVAARSVRFPTAEIARGFSIPKNSKVRSVAAWNRAFPKKPQSVEVQETWPLGEVALNLRIAVGPVRTSASRSQTVAVLEVAE